MPSWSRHSSTSHPAPQVTSILLSQDEKREKKRKIDGTTRGKYRPRSGELKIAFVIVPAPRGNLKPGYKP